MRKTFILLASLLALAGCASLGQHPPGAKATKAPNANAAQQKEKQEPVVYGSFPPDVLNGLLTAEIAAQRGRYGLTLMNYVQAARQTLDPAIIHRAMRVAQALNANQAQLDLAKLWIKAEPKSIDARQIAALQEVRRKHYDQALIYMEQILKLGGDANFDGLAAYAQRLAPKEQQQLVDLYRKLEARHPDNLELQYSLALLYRIIGDKAESMKRISSFLDAHPDYQPAMLLYGTLLYEQGKHQQALSYLRRQSRRYPDNRKLGTLYARMLIDAKKLQEAEDQFQRLVEHFPQYPALKLSHALVALENNHRKVARQELQALTGQSQVADEAHYYLGRMDDQDKKVTEAIREYDQVKAGPHFFSALARGSFLKAKQGRLDEALSNIDTLRQEMPENSENLWLVEINLLRSLDKEQRALTAANDALAQHPDSNRVLYARAMLYDQMKRLPDAERDLRKILKQEPNNAVALNALGYMLTVSTDRYQEALQLIEKAHRNDPDNPAIIDSLGWVNYKLGNLDKALTDLKKAYANYPDPEVAAHLGTVLWKTGKQKEARELFRKSMKAHPKDTAVPEAARKLGIHIPD